MKSAFLLQSPGFMLIFLNRTPIKFFKTRAEVLTVAVAGEGEISIIPQEKEVIGQLAVFDGEELL